jgi:DNA polymerase
LIYKALLYKELLQWYYNNGVVNSFTILDSIVGKTPEELDTSSLDIQDNSLPVELEEEKSFDDLKAVRTLEDLKKLIILNCDCSLKKTAKNIVFSDGNPRANIMFIGEAPGEIEDKTGKPFKGEAGKLLDKMLHAIGLNRENVYLTNIIFWRPPGNRKPTEEEISACLPFVKKHINLINPKILVLVGATAASAILNIQTGITQIRGKWKNIETKDIKNLKAIAIFHPAFLLRQPSRKREAWEDLKKIKIEIDTYT